VFCFISFIWNSKKNYVNFEFVGVERTFVYKSNGPLTTGCANIRLNFLKNLRHDHKI